jgi:hypothetical protein
VQAGNKGVEVRGKEHRTRPDRGSGFLDRDGVVVVRSCVLVGGDRLVGRAAMLAQRLRGAVAHGDQVGKERRPQPRELVEIVRWRFHWQGHKRAAAPHIQSGDGGGHELGEAARTPSGGVSRAILAHAGLDQQSVQLFRAIAVHG